MFVDRKSLKPSQKFRSLSPEFTDKIPPICRGGSIFKNSISGSPMQISSLKNIPKIKKPIALRGMLSLFAKTNPLELRAKPLMIPKKKLPHQGKGEDKSFTFVIDEKSNRHTVLQNLENYKMLIENKYSQYFIYVSGGLGSQITENDLVSYMKSKKYPKDPKLGPFQSDNESQNYGFCLPHMIIEVFDIDSDGGISSEDFFSVCSVHYMHLNSISFSFFSISLLGKLSNKIKELQIRYQNYQSSEVKNIEYLIHFLTYPKGEGNKRGIYGIINGRKFDLLMYMRFLPLFISIESF